MSPAAAFSADGLHFYVDTEVRNTGPNDGPKPYRRSRWCQMHDQEQPCGGAM